MRLRENLRRAEGRHQDQPGGGEQLTQRRQQRQIVHVRQAQVEHHDVERRRGRGHGAKRGARVTGLLDVETEIRQRFGDRPPNQRLVIDDQDAAVEKLRGRANFLPRRGPATLPARWRESVDCTDYGLHVSVNIKNRAVAGHATRKYVAVCAGVPTGALA